MGRRYKQFESRVQNGAEFDFLVYQMQFYSANIFQEKEHGFCCQMVWIQNNN